MINEDLAQPAPDLPACKVRLKRSTTETGVREGQTSFLGAEAAYTAKDKASFPPRVLTVPTGVRGR